jgi:hypothetical protein
VQNERQPDFYGIDPTKKYGQLVPVFPLERVKGCRPKWMFECDCGSRKAIRVDYVLSGHTKSCDHFHRNGLRSQRRMFREKLLASQGNYCAICREPFTATPEVDHDHRCCPQKKMCVKCVRGLLCETCNRGLGMFKDSLDLLLNAVEYLRRFNEQICQQ